MIKRLFLAILFLSVCLSVFGQQTRIRGVVKDKITGKILDYATVSFKRSQVSVYTDDAGQFDAVISKIPDTMVVNDFGYQSFQMVIDKKVYLKPIEIGMNTNDGNIGDVVIIPKGDLPSIRIFKKVIENKPLNDKSRLAAYSYRVYTKTQVDLDNLTEKFKDRGFVKRMDFITHYLDTSDKQKQKLPILFSESLSDFYYKSKPSFNREIIRASNLSGIDNFSIDHVIGDVNMEINFYDNYVNIFTRAFVSPISKQGRGFYKYRLLDSAYIDNQFCYQLSFTPKMKGGTTFEGKMWIHDSTFALKEIDATLSSVANINFINGMNIHQEFVNVGDSVWMMKDEKLTMQMGLLQRGKMFNFLVRKSSFRDNFTINDVKPDKFYLSTKIDDNEDKSAKQNEQNWDSIRPIALEKQERGVQEMTDSLKISPFFNFIKGVMWTLNTGYYPAGKVEIGDLYNLISFNPVETFEAALALRTSNHFSTRYELGGSIGYGFGNDKINWYLKSRINITPRKRGLLTLYAGTKLVQYGTSPDLGGLFSSILRIRPQDKLFYEDKIGLDLEKDIGKDLIFTFSGYSKQLTSVGLARFLDKDSLSIGKLKNTEFGLGISWGKDRQYISGAFDRMLIGSGFPVLDLDLTFGVKGILGSRYNYQKVELKMSHIRSIGIIGRINYGLSLGKYFGNVPYPFLKIHEGSETYYHISDAFNMMNYYEFISDQYITGYVEHHFQGLLLNRIPLIKKLKWRLLVSARAAWGTLDANHNNVLLIPSFTESFGRIPYVETGIGIENIFKFFRVDLIYRTTHQIKGISPFGVRFCLQFTV